MKAVMHIFDGVACSGKLTIAEYLKIKFLSKIKKLYYELPINLELHSDTVDLSADESI
jgi:hypothetical protein